MMQPYKRNDFWVPRFKSQLVEWFINYYKGKYSRSILNKLSKKRLIGWYMSLRNKINNSMLILSMFVIITVTNGINGYASQSIYNSTGNRWKGIVIHITDTRLDYDLEMCDNGHRAIGWDSCGYNYLILRDGTIQESRGLNKIGAHVKGHNSRLLGIGFVGRISATQAQIKGYKRLITDLNRVLGRLPTYPHRYYNKDKDCPVDVWHQLKKENLV